MGFGMVGVLSSNGSIIRVKPVGKWNYPLKISLNWTLEGLLESGMKINKMWNVHVPLL